MNRPLTQSMYAVSGGGSAQQDGAGLLKGNLRGFRQGQLGFHFHTFDDAGDGRT